MKFGKTFESHLTHEWRRQYMDYGELDAMIRSAVDKAPEEAPRTSRYIREHDANADPIVSEYYQNFTRNFFTVCHQELSRVEDFFAQKLAEARRKLDEIKIQLTAQMRTYNARHMGFVCCEFYLSLIMLQNFQSLNYTAFRKICKKFDKHIKSESGATWFEEHVSQAPFSKEEELMQMITEVENLYTTHLANGDRAKAMAKLRVPPLRQASPPARVFMAGMMLGLFTVSAIIVLLSIIYLYNSVQLYTFAHMYRGPFTWVLCCFYMTINVYVWQRVGINHVLIFELDARKRVQPATFLEVASGTGYLCTLSMLMYLHHKDFGVDVPYHFPLICIGLPLLLLINPIPMLHLKARMWVLRCFGRIMAAPFFHVQFADFWIADQLTSLVQCIVDNYHLARFYFRYYMKSSNAFDFEPDFMVPIIRCLPPWFRLAQCLRRYWEKHNKPRVYLVNACKYFSNIIVVIFSTILMETYANYNSMFANPWIWPYILSSLMSAIYFSLYDVIYDFGLFQIWKGENIFLRKHLVYRKSFYYFAIITNVLIRFIWVLELCFVYYNILLPNDFKAIASFLEVTRRFIWNYLRLENEHLFNVGNFRAHRDIYLYPISIANIAEDSPSTNKGVQTGKRTSF